jgi:hypothetical protein
MRKVCLLTLLGYVAVSGSQFFQEKKLQGVGPDADKMGTLPNCTLSVEAYSGYLTVTPTKMLHYVYIGS